MKHKLSKIQCLVLHWDDEGNPFSLIPKNVKVEDIVQMKAKIEVL